jgi:hypothetical protein
MSERGRVEVEIVFLVEVPVSVVVFTRPNVRLHVGAVCLQEMGERLVRHDVLVAVASIDPYLGFTIEVRACCGGS